ncbi:MOSC domain-containing protein [Candidatus Frankia alpina]|uniref:MOSC domain-containing protein n=1 Tax=Candidatus Frankia alpina TaxID=2699483 RepID=A0A4V3Z7G6_9ACTN|nr:MOSC domain-containing protein [Candidatus Frankia alpina]THJ74099.1 MOSC domain-containing protein [Candidatus Frankia alpina]
MDRGGHLVGIYTTAGRGAPMRAHSRVRVIEGRGLDGDRYAAGTGTYSARAGSGRAVTLIAREAVRAVADEGRVQLAEHETRRNLVTEGIVLPDLIGRAFRVGDVVLFGARPCPPCGYLERLLDRPGVWRALAERGGLRADVVLGGTLELGAAVVALPTP